MFPEDENPILAEASTGPNPILSETPKVELSQSDKNKSILSAVAKLPYVEQGIETFKTFTGLIEEAKAEIGNTGSTESLEKDSQTRQLKTNTDAALVSDTSTVDDKTQTLVNEYNRILNSKFPVEKEAAESLTISSRIEDMGFEGMAPSAFDLQATVAYRRLVMMDLIQKQSETLGIPDRESGRNPLLYLSDMVLTMIPPYNTEPRLGNVPGVRDPEFGDYFWPGELQSLESGYLFDPGQMSDDDFEKYAPEIAKNLVGNAFYFVKNPVDPIGAPKPYFNKLQYMQLVHELYDVPSITETNTIVTLDYLGVAPMLFDLGKLGVVTPIKLLKASRQPAKVADTAAEIMLRAEAVGLEPTLKAAGEAMDALEEVVLPKAVNPQTSVMAGTAQVEQVIDRVDRGRKLYETIGGTSIDDLARLSPDELAPGKIAQIEQLSKITGRKIKIADVEDINLTPGSGLDTPGVRITLGRVDGLGYGSEANALNAAKAMGLGDDVTIISKYKPRPDGALSEGAPRFVGKPASLDEVINKVNTHLHQNPINPKYANATLWVSEDTVKPPTKLKEIQAAAKAGDESIMVLVTRDGNLIAGKVSEFGDAKTFKEALGIGDGEVGLTVVSPKTPFKSIKELYRSVRDENMGFFRVRDGQEAKAAESGASVVRDDKDGQWYIQFDAPIDETGYYTPLPTKESYVPFLARAVLGGRLQQVRDSFASGYGASVMAEGRRNKLIQMIEKNYAPKFQALTDKEKKLLDKAARISDTENRWLSNAELQTLHYKGIGANTSASKFVTAYRAFEDLNDIEFFLRNSVIKNELSIKGYFRVKLTNTVYGANRTGTIPGYNAKVHPEFSRMDLKGIVVNAETGKHIDWPKLKNKKDLQDKGYVIVSYLEEISPGADGYQIKHMLTHRSNMEIKPVADQQFGYRFGGHRIYGPEVRWWGKAGRYGLNPDGSTYLTNPMTLIGGITKQEVVEWANMANKAVLEIERYLAGDLKTLRNATDIINRSNGTLPEVDELVNMVKSKQLSSATPFEAVEDRALPTIYREVGSDISHLEEVNPLYDHMRSTGRLYTSARGKEVKIDAFGQELPTLDVYGAINKSISNVATLTAFGPYRISKMERWLAQYEKLLDLKPGMSLAQRFDAPFKENLTRVESRLKITAMKQRSTTRRLLGWQGPQDEWLNSIALNVIDSVDKYSNVAAGRAVVKGAVKGREGMASAYNLAGTVAFDSKMGLGDFTEPLLQITTTLTTLGVDISKTVEAIAAYRIARFLDTFKDEAKILKFATGFRGKILGYEDPREFLEMLRSMKDRTGFSIVNRTHAVLDEGGYNLNPLFGKVGQVIQKVRDFGRVPFYETERANKIITYNVAWKMARERFPNLNYNSQAFKEKVAGIGDTLNLGMSNAASAAWQKGIAGLPTKFWSYPVRVNEMLFGEELTKVQRARYFLMSYALFGAAGITGMSLLADTYNQVFRDGQVPTMENDPLMAMAQRGVVDRLLYETLNADVAYGERMGAGRFLEDLLRDWTGMSRYQDVSAVELMGGASYSILFDIGEGLGNVTKYLAVRSGQGGAITDDQKYAMVLESLNDTAKNISSWNAAMKLYVGFKTKQYETKSGIVIVDDLNNAEVVLSAFGIQPAEQLEINAMMAWSDQRKASVDSVVKSVQDAQNRFQAAWEQGDQKAMDRITNEVRGYILFTPEELRPEVFDKLDRFDTQSSFYQNVLSSFKKRKQRDEINKLVNEQLKEGSN